MKHTDINNQNTLGHSKRKRKWYYNSYLRILIKGFVVTLPFVILLFLLSLGFKLVFNMLSPLNGLLHTKATEPHWSLNILSLFVLLGFFFLVGLFLRNRSGKDSFTYFENEFFSHIPLYTPLRDLIHQIAGFKKMPFKQVVLVDPFDSGVLMTGFVAEEIKNGLFTVFVPTAPNPTNGNIYHVPASRLKFIDIKAEKAISTVIGMGTGSSCLFFPDENHSKKIENPAIHHQNQKS